MASPSLDHVQAYYDARINARLRDFTHANPRIEAAVQTVADWAPRNPSRILEIGCGIGATSWRMSRAWPASQVVGVDVSRASIAVANVCFRRKNLTYVAGALTGDLVDGKFDLVVLMDVYEHIALEDRPSFHAVLKSLLSDESRVVVTLPTAELTRSDRATDPGRLLQPVDEEVDLPDVARLATETATSVIYYRKIGVWNYGDYAHLVLARFRLLADVPQPAREPGAVAALTHQLRRLLGRDVSASSLGPGYFGPDLPHSPRARSRMNVTPAVRRRLSSSWLIEHTAPTA